AKQTLEDIHRRLEKLRGERGARAPRNRSVPGKRLPEAGECSEDCRAQIKAAGKVGGRLLMSGSSNEEKSALEELAKLALTTPYPSVKREVMEVLAEKLAKTGGPRTQLDETCRLIGEIAVVSQDARTEMAAFFILNSYMDSVHASTRPCVFAPILRILDQTR